MCVTKPFLDTISFNPHNIPVVDALSSLYRGELKCEEAK